MHQFSKFSFLALVFIFFISSCTRNNVNHKKEYKEVFDKYNMQGTFATYDNVYDQFNVYNFKRYADSAYSPASTYKIIVGLMGLENGIIFKNETVKFNGDPNDSLKKDLKLNEAMRTSSNWYFKDVMVKLGRDTLQRMLDSLKYGNMKIDTVPNYFYNNTLTIRPDEQMGLLKKLYFKKLNKQFSNRTMDAIKESMEMESTDKYTLCFKTGTTTGTTGKPLGWLIGWVETKGANPKVNFFVLNADGKGTMDELITNRPLLFRELMKKEGLL